MSLYQMHTTLFPCNLAWPLGMRSVHFQISIHHRQILFGHHTLKSSKAFKAVDIA